MRVLLVEGDYRLATSLRRALNESGMTTDIAHDGEEGLAAALANEYDVIVLDVMLPVLDGRQVVHELRDRRVNTPILMLTTLDPDVDRPRDADTSVNDHLVKPFSQRELMSRIGALGRRHPGDRRAKLRAGQIVLDTIAHVVRVADQAVDLTAKEFSILEYLMANRGRVLTRAQILEHAWNYDFGGGRNLIEVYIGRLRRKLADAGAGEPIVTVRGAGYRFELPD